MNEEEGRGIVVLVMMGGWKDEGRRTKDERLFGGRERERGNWCKKNDWG